MREDTEELLFNLASSDRLLLLSSINQKKQRLTDLAKIMKASNQECSRHLARLSSSGFVIKDPDGAFETTPLGRAVLRIFPSLQFLLDHRTFFLSHDVSCLPKSFAERIGELSEGKLVGHFNIVLEHIKKVIMEGREYVWLIADQPIVPTSSLGGAFSSRSVPVKLILKEGYDLKTFSAARSVLPEKFEIATLNDVKIAMAINEKLAGICFPTPDGKIDFGVGFTGADQAFRTWCSDLFTNYWNKTTEFSSF